MSQKFALAFIVLFLCVMTLYKGGCTIIDLRPNATSIDYSVIDPTLDPVQKNFESINEIPILKKIAGVKALLTPKAHYKITGRVVSKRHYHMDWLSKLSPVDLAIAWGPFATKKYDDNLTYSHGDRYYSFWYSGEFDGDPKVIATHSANEHLIPANTFIAKVLKSIKVDEVVMLEGLLVNVEWIDEKLEVGNLSTSLTRDDTGAGACEIIYVTKVKIKSKVYQ
jgi:hypothetical protein